MEVPTKTGWGGKRTGSGRKPKGHKPPTLVAGVDFEAAMSAPVPDEIDGIAQQHARTAIASLVKLLAYGASESAKITAAKEILDRGYGKPAVEIGGDAAMLPFMQSPSLAAVVSLSAEVRTEARRFANLAIEVLKKIADAGSSETARASASKALLDRGLGTVGKARMPDEQREQPLGKKEQQQRAAQVAATGRYATPAPPPPRALDAVQ